MIKMQDKYNSVLGYLYVNKDSYEALDVGVQKPEALFLHWIHTGSSPCLLYCLSEHSKLD